MRILMGTIFLFPVWIKRQLNRWVIVVQYQICVVNFVAEINDELYRLEREKYVLKILLVAGDCSFFFPHSKQTPKRDICNSRVWPKAKIIHCEVLLRSFVILKKKMRISYGAYLMKFQTRLNSVVFSSLWNESKKHSAIPADPDTIKFSVYL